MFIVQTAIKDVSDSSLSKSFWKKCVLMCYASGASLRVALRTHYRANQWWLLILIGVFDFGVNCTKVSIDRTAGAAHLRSWVGRKSRGKLHKWFLFCENWEGDRIKFLKLCSLKHQKTFECNNSSASQGIWIFWKLRIPLNESQQWDLVILLQISKLVLFLFCFSGIYSNWVNDQFT